MLDQKHQFRFNSFARVLGTTRSGYYARCKLGKEPSKQLKDQQRRDEQNKAVFTESSECYGACPIKVELAEKDADADVKTTRNSMERQNVAATAAHKFKVTTDSNHQLPVTPNVLEQNFDATGPNQKWVGDITYLMTSEG